MTTSASPQVAVPADHSDREVSITRVFDAPRELVFQAWTDPAMLARWFAPHGCSIEFAQAEPRPGGRFHSCIRTPDGQECWCKGDYLEVTPPERLIFTMIVSNAQGESLSPLEAGMDADWPQETRLTVTFVEQDGRTTLTLQQTVSEALAKRTGAHPSWLQMLDRLAESLAGQ